MSEWVERQSRVPSFTREETVTADTTSAAIFVPPINSNRNITVTAMPGSGTAKVQFTTSSEAKVIANTAIWQDWDSGSVAAITTDRLLSPITAIRLVAVTDDADFEIVV